MILDNFPVWNPQNETIRKMKSSDRKIAYKAFRSSSSAFVSNKIVRNTIFKRDNHKCVECNDKYNLTVDHVISVLKCFQDKRLDYCNTKKNLQTLCNSCNCAKLP